MCQYICLKNICIPSYGLMLTLGIFICGLLILQRAKQIGIENDEMIVVMSVSLGVALFSAGLLYILISYSINELVSRILSGDFSFIKNGGLVFYGGLIGGIIGAVLALKWQRIDIGKAEQSIVPILPLGHAVGRVGCLLAGCCYGLEYSGPLAVNNFLVSAGKTFFPIQLIEAFLNLGIFLFLLWYTQKKRHTFHILCIYLQLYSVLRFILEFFRGDLNRGIFLMMSTSQWMSIGIFLVSLICYYIFRKHKI